LSRLLFIQSSPRHTQSKSNQIEELRKHAAIMGIDPAAPVRIVSTEAIGDDALTVYYKTVDGTVLERMLFRADEPQLSLAQAGRPWAVDSSLFCWLSSHHSAPLQTTSLVARRRKMAAICYLRYFTVCEEVRRRAPKDKGKRASRARLHGFGCPPGIHECCKY
jgi:hypothetical protein